MKVMRLSWSSYQTAESLRLEKTALEAMGLDYSRPSRSGTVPGNLPEQTLLIVNSQFPVDVEFLDRWSPGPDGLLITTTSGYDHIDCPACLDRGITVARTPRARAPNVVRHTLAMLDALHRHLVSGTGQLQAGHWDRESSLTRVTRPAETSIGVVGYGVIGRRLVNRLQERGYQQVYGFDPARQTRIKDRSGIRYAPLDDLLETSRFVTLHAALTPSSRDLIGREELDQMGSDAFLVNTARGELVDEPALRDALREGRLAGAALDVFDPEPPEEAWPRDANLVLTPHTAGFGPDLLDNLREELLETIARFLDDDPVPSPVVSPTSGSITP